MQVNPFEEIVARLDALATDVRTLKRRAEDKPPKDELGGLELAQAVTGLAPSTLYKLTSRGEIPHSKPGGRLYFRRSELEQWLMTDRKK